MLSKWSPVVHIEGAGQLPHVSPWEEVLLQSVTPQVATSWGGQLD